MNPNHLIKNVFSKMMARGVLLAAALCLASCSPIVDQRGHVAAPDWKEHIIPGSTTKNDVATMLGSPSSTSSFGNEVWYYISTKKETTAFLKPEITQQNVIRIEFSADDTVAAVEEFDKEKSREDFAFVERTTPTEGHSLGILEQLLGNIGRFNAPGGSTAGSTINRSPGY